MALIHNDVRDITKNEAMINEQFTKRMAEFCDLMCCHVSSEFTDFLRDNGFFASPASTKYHGNYHGGLFDHSLSVTRTLIELTEKNDLKWQNGRSPYVVGMFHDICKLGLYEWNSENSVFVYRENAFRGHGDRSVTVLSQFYELTEEERLCIRYHMGAFVEKEEWRQYTDAIHRYNNVLWTHHADMIVSHVKGV